MNIFGQNYTVEQMVALFESKPVIYLSVTGAVIGVGILLRNYMQGGKYRKNTSAKGKVIIITGANSGIGKAAALELAQRGAHVYMACRDMNKSKKARDEIILKTQNKNVFCRELDLASFESIRKFANEFKGEQSKLDVLVNNAGVFCCPYSHTKEGFEMQIGVNHVGHFLLTDLLLDLLKKTAPSRIVTVSGIVQAYAKMNVEDLNSDKSYNTVNAYNQSKLANVLFTRELAKRLEGTGVTANSLHPGLVDTDVMRHIGFFNTAVFRIFFKPLLLLFLKSSKAGAQTTIYAALEPDLEKVSGLYFSDCKPKDTGKPAKDDEMAKWLWSVTEEWIRNKS